MLVPAPGWLSMTSLASSTSSRSRRPARPESAAGRAPPTPSSTTATRRRSSATLEAHRGLRGRGVLDDVREGFRNQEVGSELDRVGQTIPGRALHGHRERRPPRERLDRSQQALLAQQGRVNAAGKLAQLRDRLVDLVARARRARPARPRSPRAAAMPSASESVTSRCWAPSWRLRSIRRRSASVAATMRVRDARTSASCARTSAARRSFSSTSPAVARTASTSAGSSSNAGSCTSAATSSPRTVTSVIARSGPCGSSSGRPAGVDVAAVAEAIGDVDRRVAEHRGEALAQARRSVGPQLDDEVGRLRSTQPRPRQSRDEPERDEQRDPAVGRLRAWPSPRRSRSSRPARRRAEEV